MPRCLDVLMGILLVVLATGCSAGRGFTVVERHLKPSHFKFVTIVERTETGADGWRAACLYLHLKEDTGAEFICKVGVGVPLETDKQGPLSVARAQRVAANCANLAADMALGATTVETPLGIACSSFIETYRVILARALTGSRVTMRCRPEAESFAVP